MPDGRHPAPPYYRTARPGRQTVKSSPVAIPAQGRRQINTSVPPLVVADGLGDRQVFELRSISQQAPLNGIDDTALGEETPRLP